MPRISRNKSTGSMINHKVQYIAKKDDGSIKKPQVKSIQLPHVNIVGQQKYGQQRGSQRVSKQMDIIMENTNEDVQGLSYNQKQYQKQKENMNQNIFDQSYNVMLKHGLSGCSPIYVNKQIVKYSLVGTEEEYEKAKKQLEESSSRGSSASNNSQASNKSSVSQMIMNNPQFKKRMSYFDQNRMQVQNNRKIGQIQKKKQKQKMHKQTQKQLWDNINKVEQQLNDDKKQYQQQFYENKYKQQRVLDKHDLVQQKWNKYRNSRDCSVMDDQNRYREKVEINNVIDWENKKRRGVQEMSWISRLRDYNTATTSYQQPEVIKIEWPYRASQTTTNQMSQTHSMWLNDSNSILSRSSNRVWLKDSNSQTILDRKIRGLDLNRNDLETIKLEGVNILQREKAWLMEDGTDNDRVYFKITESRKIEQQGPLL